MSTVVATVMAHPDKYMKDFNIVVTFLSQYINKKAPKPSVKIASVTQTRPAKRQKTSASHNILRGKIELKKYSQKEHYSMSAARYQQLHELWKKARLRKQQNFRG